MARDFVLLAGFVLDILGAGLHRGDREIKGQCTKKPEREIKFQEELVGMYVELVAVRRSCD